MYTPKGRKVLELIKIVIILIKTITENINK